MGQAEVEQGGARRRRVAGATAPAEMEQGWVTAAPAEAEHGGGGQATWRGYRIPSALQPIYF